jgi:hypothetical protein
VTHRHGIDRREFLAVTLALAGPARVAFRAERERSKRMLILFGTAGEPRPRPSAPFSGTPAQAGLCCRPCSAVLAGQTTPVDNAVLEAEIHSRGGRTV